MRAQTTMKKIFMSVSFAIVAMFTLGLQQVSAQCANDNVLWTTGPTVGPGGSYTIFGQWAGEYSTIGVVSGTTYTFSTCGGASYDTQITIYNNAGGGALGYNDDFCGLQSTLVWTATFTGTLRVLTDQYFCTSLASSTTITITAAGGGGAANDLICGATVVPCGGSFSGNTATATPDVAPNCAATSGANGLWYRLVGAAPGSVVTISLCGGGTTYDSQINVYQSSNGACTGTLTCVAGNDDFCGLQSQTAFVAPAVVGQTFFILINGFSTSSGAFAGTITCTVPVACPDFTFAAPFTHSSSTIGSGDDCSLRAGTDRTYAITIACPGTYTFSMCGSSPNWDSYMYLTSSCCSGIIAQDDDGCGGIGVSVISGVSLTPGTYYLDIEPFSSGGAGNYTLNVSGVWNPGAAVISGPTTVCAGASATYTVTAGVGVSTYTWSGPAGSTVTSGQGTTTATIAFGSTSGNVSVVRSGACGTAPAVTYAVGVTNVVVNAGPDVAICSGSCTTLNGTINGSGSGGGSAFYDFNTGMQGWTASDAGLSCGGGSFGTSTFGSQGFGFSGSSIGTTSIGGTHSAITSPVLTFGSSVTVSLQSWANNESGYPCFYDTEFIEYSTNGGATWTPFFTTAQTSLHITSAGGWTALSYTASVTPTANGRIRFRYDTGDGCCGPTTNNPGWFIDNVTINAGGGASFSWSNGATTSSTTVCPTSTTTYTLTGTVSGCTSSDQVVVTVNPLPTANAGSDVTICNGQCTTLNAAGTNLSYDFNGSSQGWTSGNAGINCLGVNWGVNTWANQAFGFSGQSMGVPTVAGQHSFLQSPAFTTGTSLTLSFNSYSNNEGGYPCFYDVELVEYSTNGGATWNPFFTTFQANLHNFGMATWQTISYTAATSPSANAMVRFRYDTGDGCCGPGGANIGWYIDNVAITSNASSGGVTYAWSNGATTASTTVCPTSTTTYTVTVTNSFGCSASDQVVVTVNPNPVVNAGPDQTICAGQCAQLQATATVSGFPTFSYNFNSGNQGWTTGNNATTCAGLGSGASTWSLQGWSQGGSSLGTQNYGNLGAENSWIMSPIIPIGANLSVTFDSYSNNESGYPCFYDVELVEYTTNGGATWIPMVTAFNANLHNFGDATWRNVTVSATPTPGAGRVRFRYDTGDGCCGPGTANSGWYVDNVTITGTSAPSFSWTPPTGLSCTTCSNPIACPTGTTTYTVTGTVNGCSSSDQVTVTVNPLPNASITPSGPTTFCQGGSVTLTAGPSGGFSYQWSNGATTQSITVSASGSFSVTVTNTSTGCQASAGPVNVTVNPLPIANAGPDASVCAGACTQLNGTSGPASVTYNFNSGSQGWTSASAGATCIGFGTIAPTWAVQGFGFSGTSMGTQNYGNMGAENSYIMSPVLGWGSTLNLSFKSFSNNEGGYPCFYDTEWVEYSTNGGATWIALTTSFNAALHNFGIATWNTITYAASVTPTANGRIRFRMDTGDGCCGPFSANLGWYIDDVVIGAGSNSFSWSPSGSLSCSACASPIACPPSTTTYTLTVTDNNGCQNTDQVTVTVNPNPVPNPVAATFNCGYNVSCNGACDGSANANVSSGTAPFTYLWSNGQTTATATGLCAGTYSVTVVDVNGCTGNGSVTLTQPAVLTCALYDAHSPPFNCGYNVSCYGACDGAFGADVQGGCAPYTYLWSTGATTQIAQNLCAGAVSCTITDANGCVTTCSASLTQPDPLVNTGTAGTYNCGYNVSCNGACDGSIDQTTTGGCAPYSYFWSDGGSTEDRTGLCAGTYSVTVVDDNGCMTTSSYTLTQPDVLTATCPANTTVYLGSSFPGYPACATLSPAYAGGASCTAYSYSWSTGATTASITVCPSVTTTYTVTVTDANGCTATCSVTVCVVDVRCGNNLQNITICHFPQGNPNNPQTLCISGNAVLSHINGAHVGDYLGPCGSNIPCATLKTNEPSAAASEDVIAGSMEAFPNPFDVSTTLAFRLTSDDHAVLKIYSLTGIEVATLFDGEVIGGELVKVEFKPENVSEGVYIARLVTNNIGEITRRLVWTK
jgi:hypothetical protein